MTSLVVAGTHPLMQKIRSLASRLATCDTAALLQGEQGTGKRDLALHIHQQSRRSMGPFVSADCTSATSTEDLAEMVEKAYGGTIFFADIGTLDPELHPFLSTLLDGRKPHSRTDSPNVRMIGAAESELVPNPDDDLFERLCRVSLFLPPLRERRSDIPLLIRHLLDRHASALDGPVRRVPDDALVLLWQYDWPGNLRELADVVRESAAVTADGVIRASLLPARIRCSFKHGTLTDPPGRGLEDRHSYRTLADDELDPSILR
jgi:DNA-binding NtrC family response regulator